MPQNLLKPKALQKGARVGVVSPACAPPPELIEAGKAALEGAGFQVFIHPQCSKKDFQLAGSDKERAGAIMDMFQDPAIDAIMCARGGIGSYRTVPHLDFNSIRQNPKIFCGFSDITTLLLTLHQRTGLVTFHGIMLYNLFAEHDDYNLPFLTDLFFGKLPLNKPIPFTPATCLNEGQAEGRLIGGNITLLQHLIGSTDAPDTNGAILFIEDDAGEKISDIDRKLWHFKTSGLFDHIKGLIVGEFNGFREDSAGEWGHSIESMLHKLIPPHIPVCTHFPCGHGRKMATLPEGVKVHFETSANGTFLSFLESPFA